MAAGPFFSLQALDAQLNNTISKGTTIRLVEPYDIGDSHTTVVNNTKGSAAIGSTSTYWSTISTVNSFDRRATFLGATGAANADWLSPTDTWLVITDDSGLEVLAATNETTDKPVSDLDVIEFPSFYIESRQPILVA